MAHDVTMSGDGADEALARPAGEREWLSVEALVGIEIADSDREAAPGESWRDRLARVACERGGSWAG